MPLDAYVTAGDFVPDPQYVNDPQQTQEYFAWIIGTNGKQNMWVFFPAVDSPTQDLVNDILPSEYEFYVLDDDLQKYGIRRTLMLSEPISKVEDFFNDEFAAIESLY